jgi:hypothetical protein
VTIAILPSKSCSCNLSGVCDSADIFVFRLEPLIVIVQVAKKGSADALRPMHNGNILALSDASTRFTCGGAGVVACRWAPLWARRPRGTVALVALEALSQRHSRMCREEACVKNCKRNAIPYYGRLLKVVSGLISVARAIFTVGNSRVKLGVVAKTLFEVGDARSSSIFFVAHFQLSHRSVYWRGLAVSTQPAAWSC